MKRHQIILEKLAKEKHLEVLELCELLNVSAVTIRKDLRLLEEKGLLFRTHGGASLENPYINEKAIGEKEKISVEEKQTTDGPEIEKLNETIEVLRDAESSMFSKIQSLEKQLAEERERESLLSSNIEGLEKQLGEEKDVTEKLDAEVGFKLLHENTGDLDRRATRRTVKHSRAA